jgi:hypothetical protein
LLAKQEQFDIYVKGNTLYFHPATPPDADPFVVVWDGTAPYSNATEITLGRNMRFANDILVECRSWNSQQARGFTAQAGSTNAPISRQFRYVFPNFSQAECQAKAEQILADLSRHERLLAFSRPADFTISARSPAKLQGTASVWDGIYIIDSVTRAMSFEQGFIERIQAKSYPR